MVGIILACGESKRMNQNKLLLEFNGKTIIENVIEKAMKSNLDQVIVVCRHWSIMLKAEALGAIALINNNYSLGQSESIKVGVDYIDSTEDIMFIVGDIPLLDIQTINKMICIHYINKGIVVARNNGKNSNPVIFSAEFRNDLLSLQGDIGGREIISNYKSYVTYLDVLNPLELIDIDTPEDYKRLLSIELE